MNDLTFLMRLTCTYADPNNSVDQLNVEVMLDGEWTSFDLTTGSPGFDIFMYAIFTCQHMYFRVNAAEHGLMLTSSDASITMRTDADRNIKLLHVDFRGMLKSGLPTEDDVDYIIERMKLCPVSCNIKDAVDTKTVVSFESA